MLNTETRNRLHGILISYDSVICLFLVKGSNYVLPVPAESRILTDTDNTSKTLNSIKELVIQSESTNKITGLERLFIKVENLAMLEGSFVVHLKTTSIYSMYTSSEYRTSKALCNFKNKWPEQIPNNMLNKLFNLLSPQASSS